MALTPDIVAEVKQLVAAALVSLNPAFDERIKQLSGLKREVEDRLGLIKTIENAETKAKSIISNAEVTATMRLKAVADRISELEAGEKLLVSQKQEFQLERENFDTIEFEHQTKMAEDSRRMANSFSDLARREARIETKEKDIAAAEESVHRREEELASHTRRIREAVHPLGK